MSNSVKASSLPVTERTPSHVDLACLYSFSEQEEVNCMSPTLPDLLSPHSCLTASANPPAALRGGLVTPHQSRQPEMPSNGSNPHRSDRAGLCFTVYVYIYIRCKVITRTYDGDEKNKGFRESSCKVSRDKNRIFIVLRRFSFLSFSVPPRVHAVSPLPPFCSPPPSSLTHPSIPTLSSPSHSS